jgi:aromatic ring-cleaving dioxygenase
MISQRQRVGLGKVIPKKVEPAVKLLLEKDFRNFHAAKDKKSILLKKTR